MIGYRGKLPSLNARERRQIRDDEAKNRVKSLDQMLKKWDDTQEIQTLSEASDLIHELRVSLAGKEAVIEAIGDKIRRARE